MNTHILSIVLIAALTGTLLSWNLFPRHIGFALSSEPQLRVIVSPGLPIKLVSVIVESKEESPILRYRVTNESNEHIKEGRITVRFYRRDKELITWYVEGTKWDIAPHSSSDIVTDIEKEITRADVVLIVVTQVEGEKSLWKVDSSKLNEAIRNYLRGKPYTLPKAEWWELVEKRNQKGVRQEILKFGHYGR